MVSVEVFALVVTILVWLLIGAVALVVRLRRLLEGASDRLSAVASGLEQVEKDMWTNDVECLWWQRLVSYSRRDLIRLVQDMNSMLQAMDLGLRWYLLRREVRKRIHKELSERSSDASRRDADKEDYIMILDDNK